MMKHFLALYQDQLKDLFILLQLVLLLDTLLDFFFVEEKKLQGIFRRDLENRLALKQDILDFIKTIKQRYISFIIFVFIILLLSLYYLLCFNYVYPKTQIEWIKSSIVIMIIVQIISVIKCFYEASARFLSFKFKSQRLFKASKLFD